MIQHPPPEMEIKKSLVSSGMTGGWHTWAAIVLVIIAFLLGVAAQSISAPALCTFFLASAIGLLGEVPCLLRTGEVRARLYSRSGLKANVLLVIRKIDSPVRFYFYVVIYAVLGFFSIGAAGFIAFRLVSH